MQRSGLTSWIVNYLLIGTLWCFIVNIHAFVTGAPSPLMSAAGPSTGMAKALGVAQVLGHQIVIWPLEIYDKVLHPIFG